MKLPILTDPHPILRRVAKKVSPRELRAEWTQQLINDMFESMRAVGGIGLAAPQVGVDRRIFVVDLSEFVPGEFPRVFVNPVIGELEGEEVAPEACLSKPASLVEVRRAMSLVVRAWDQYGYYLRVEAEGLLARCIQHEVDHLCGKLIIDVAERVLSWPEEMTNEAKA